MKTVALIVAAALVAAVSASCPKLCSGRGACTQDDKCQCWAGYTGYDCSQRACPLTEAWAVDDYEGAHVYAECANKGICDRSTGLCDCFEGYEGRACERSSCPNACSGHGKCRMIADLEKYVAGTNDKVPADYKWDEKAITTCVCDGGYMGPDCSQRICPFGDDPMTVCEQGDTEQIQRIDLTFPFQGTPEDASGNAGALEVDNNDPKLALRYTTPAGTEFYTGTIDLGALAVVDATQNAFDTLPVAIATNLETALEALPNFAVMAVATSTDGATTTTAQLLATFLHETEGNSYGPQNLLRCPHRRAMGTVSTFNGDKLYTYGCGAAGCQPVIKQPRLVLSLGPQQPALGTDDANNDLVAFTAVAAPADVRFAPESVLTCPEGVQCILDNNNRFLGYLSVYVSATKDVFVEGGDAEDGEILATHVPELQAGASVHPDFVAQTITDPATANQNTGYKFIGNLADFSADATLASHKRIPVNQIMKDTELLIDDSIALNSFTRLLYTPISCTDAVDITVAGDPFENANVENIECSGRGQCNRESGQCACFEGYTGLACGEQTVLM